MIKFFKFLLLTISLFFSIQCFKPPVIAILANPQPDNTNDAQLSRVNYKYVRWLEQNRAEVVVIHPWYSKEQIGDIVSKSNGLLWLGGDRDLLIGGQFETAAKYILEKVMDLFDNHNISVPLWGTCQGFELLHILVADSLEVLDHFNSYNIQSPIELNQKVKSKMFADFSKIEISYLQNYNSTAQFHNLGVGEKQYEDFPLLRNFFEISSFGYDLNGKKYIASMESKRYPIFAVQFHPEMVSYTRGTSRGVPQSLEAIRVSQLLGDFFFKQIFMNHNYMDLEDMMKYDHLNSFEKLPILEDEYYFYRFEKKNKYVKEFTNMTDLSELKFLMK